MGITIYTKPNCVQCNATKRSFDKAGVEYDLIDVSKDAVAYNRIVELGYRQVPVVMTQAGAHWSGYRPEAIREAVAAVTSSQVA